MSLALVVEILGDASKLGKSIDDAAGKVGGFGSGMKSALGGGIGQIAAFAGIAGVASLAISDMTNAAAEDAQEQARMEAAIRASGAATGDWKAQTDAAIATAQDKAFTDTQARDALVSLTTATGDVTTATALMNTAMDVARFANVDLATASDAVAKAQAGQDGALRKLMPGLAKGKSATDTLAAATAAAAGQADTYANSTVGMQAKAGDAFSELTETIGSVFLPVLQEILPQLIPVIQAFGKLITAILPVLLPLLKLVGSALGIVARAIATVVDWLVRLVNWLGNAISAVGDFLSHLNPLANFRLPSLPFLSSSTAGLGAGPMALTRGAGQYAASGGGNIIINISGDPAVIEATVVRALRSYGRRNALAGSGLGLSR